MLLNRSVNTILLVTLTACASGIGAGLSTVQSAQASPITYQLDFTADRVSRKGFGGLLCRNVDTVVGSITVTFDPREGKVSDKTTNITLESINMRLDSPIAFNYSPFDDGLTIGALESGVSRLVGDNRDFKLSISNASTAPTAVTFVYTLGCGIGFAEMRSWKATRLP